MESGAIATRDDSSEPPGPRRPGLALLDAGRRGASSWAADGFHVSEEDDDDDPPSDTWERDDLLPPAQPVIATRPRHTQTAGLTVTVGQRSYALDSRLAEIVLAILEAAAAGGIVEVTSHPAVLTTGQAAELLGVSRPTVVKLIDSGELPAVRVGTRRRITLADVLAYRDRVRTRRSAAVEEIVGLSQDLDLH